MSKSKRKRSKTHVTRQVYYYRPKQIAMDLPVWNCDSVLAALLLIEPQYRYRELDDGDKVFFVDKTKDDKIVRIILGRQLIIDKPCLDDNGEFKPIASTGSERVAELTHIVLFPSGIVAAEFNIRGARISQFGSYLNEKCPQLGVFNFKPILEPDTYARIKRLEDIKLIRFAVRASEFDLLDKTNIGSYMRGVKDKFKAGSVDIQMKRTLVPGAKSKQEKELQAKLNEEFDEEARKFIEDVMENGNGKEIAESIRITAREGTQDRKHRRGIAILGEHLIRQNLEIPPTVDGLPNSQFIFDEIIKLEELKRDELLKAAEIDVE